MHSVVFYITQCFVCDSPQYRFVSWPLQPFAEAVIIWASLSSIKHQYTDL